MRRPSPGLALALSALVAVVTGVSAQSSLAAIDKAVIGATADGTAATQYSGVEATVDCPAGQRAVGGGIVQSGGADQLGLRASGPLDETGTMAGTKDGDKPRSWYAAATNETTSPVSFRVFAVCAKGRATVEVKRFAMDTGEGKGASVACPGSKRVVGGGVLPSGGYGGSFVRESGPTDASGSFRKTRDGDVARRWRAAMHNQGGSEFFKVMAVCAKRTKAKLQVKSLKLPAAVTTSDAQVPCKGKKRALGGGVLHNRGLDGYFIVSPSGPLDETGVTSNTVVGDVPTQWYGGVGSIFGGPAAKVKVASICA